MTKKVTTKPPTKKKPRLSMVARLERAERARIRERERARKPGVIDLVYETLREIRNSQARIEKHLRIVPPPRGALVVEPPPRIDRQTPFNWSEPEAHDKALCDCGDCANARHAAATHLEPELECHEHGCPPSQCVEAHRIEDANRRALESAAAMLKASKSNGFA
jgi:hypothetical protein